MRSVAERIGSKDELYRRMGENWSNNLKVACPGIITAFDYNTQTATVQPTIRERIADFNGNVEWVQLPLLLDVPIVFPRAGGFVLTMPVTVGDECLVIFADNCIDAWFSNGGIQNQIEKRRHDLSDAFAIMGCWSQPKVIGAYSKDSAQLRTDDGKTVISLKPGEININAAEVKINGKAVV